MSNCDDFYGECEYASIYDIVYKTISYNDYLTKKANIWIYLQLIFIIMI